MIFTNKEWERLYDGTVKNHIDLVKWLYDNHKDILREYEKTKGNLGVEFLNEGDTEDVKGCGKKMDALGYIICGEFDDLKNDGKQWLCEECEKSPNSAPKEQRNE